MLGTFFSYIWDSLVSCKGSSEQSGHTSKEEELFSVWGGGFSVAGYFQEWQRSLGAFLCVCSKCHSHNGLYGG